LLAHVATAGAATPGSLTQLAGTAGCIKVGGDEGCAPGRGLSEASGIALSPDAKSAYAVSNTKLGQNTAENFGYLASFSRDPSSGALKQLPGNAGCSSTDGTDGIGGSCAMGSGLGGARDVVVSPDGHYVYVAASGGTGGGNSIAIFARDSSTGALTQASGAAGCITDGSTPPCATATKEIRDLRSLAVSPDGKFLYAVAAEGDGTNFNGAVTVYSIDPATGALTLLADPNGCFAYNAPGGMNCTQVRAMREPTSLAISPAASGSQVYVSASEGRNAAKDGALVTLNRSATTGVLTQPAGTAGCANKTGNDDGGAGTCATAKALHDANEVIVSGDGKDVYIASQGEAGEDSGLSGAVAVFGRDTGSGSVSQLAGTAGCVSNDGTDGVDGATTGTCATARALIEPTDVVVSPDGGDVYVAGSDYPGSLNVFARDGSTGALTQLSGSEGCVSQDGGLDANGGQTCAAARALSEPNDLAVSPETAASACKDVYAAVQNSHGISVFGRQPLCVAPLAPAPPTPPAPVPAPTPELSGGPTITPTAFFAAATGGSIARQTGAQVSYTDSHAATTTFVVLSKRRGVTRGGQCVKRRRGARRGPRCTRLVPVGSYTSVGADFVFKPFAFSHNDQVGANSLRFTGRVGGKRLKPGKYQLNATPSLQGKTGSTRSAAFGIRRR
jgi:6-phosphogluconolactonase (cycloisomerase 2 family)